MNILTEIIESENIDDIFCSPKDYVDESYDRPLIRIWIDGNESFTVLIGIDEDENVYLVAEDDEVSKDFYPNDGESLWDVYERLIDDWIEQ